MPSVEQSERIGGYAFFGIPIFDLVQLLLDTYGRGEVVVSVLDRLPSFLTSRPVLIGCFFAGCVLLELSHKREVQRLQREGTSRIIDTSWGETDRSKKKKWLLPIATGLVVAIVIIPLVAIGYDLAYKGIAPVASFQPPPPPLDAYVSPTVRKPQQPSVRVGPVTTESGGITQIGGSGNTATITNLPQPRLLTQKQNNELSDLAGMIPEGVMGLFSDNTPEAASYARSIYEIFKPILKDDYQISMTPLSTVQMKGNVFVCIRNTSQPIFPIAEKIANILDENNHGKVLVQDCPDKELGDKQIVIYVMAQY